MGENVFLKIEAEQLDFDQWEQVVNKGLELAYDQTIIELQHIEVTSQNQKKKSIATSILHSYGEESIVLSLEEARDLNLI